MCSVGEVKDVTVGKDMNAREPREVNRARKMAALRDAAEAVNVVMKDRVLLDKLSLENRCRYSQVYLYLARRIKDPRASRLEIATEITRVTGYACTWTSRCIMDRLH